jgi:hypothetical protein
MTEAHPSRVARRALLAAPLALLAAPLLPGAAFAAEKMAPIGKIFPYLDAFLKMPAGERTHVRVDYYVLRDGKPPVGLQAWFVAPNGQRSPANLTADGRFLRIPTLAELQGGLQVAFNADAGAKMGIRLELGPAAHPAQEMEAHELAVSIDEVNRVIGKAAGPMSLVAPKMAQVVCVGAPNGLAVFPDGHTQPLGVFKGQAAYNPLSVRGATKVRLIKPPSRLVFAPA